MGNGDAQMSISGDEFHALEKESLGVAIVGAAKGNREDGAIADVASNLPPHQFVPLRRAGGDFPTTVIIEKRIFIRDCLLRCLSDGNKNTIIQSFSTVEEWLSERPSISPSLVMVLCFAERTQAEVERDVALLKRTSADIPVIVLSDREDARSVLSALDKGARGYIPTSMAFDAAALVIHFVRSGGTFVPACTLLASRDSIENLPSRLEVFQKGHLTARQSNVVEALQQGKSNKIIAYELNMCESTVKVHVRNIMKKLGAKNRTEVAFLMNAIEKNGFQGDLVEAKNSSFSKINRALS
jgi:DNA-binding NarL/FixJ family response regulator